MNRKTKPLTAIGCALGLLGGCAATPKLPPEIAAHPELAQAAMERSVLDVYDPIEGFNRAVYHFNAGFDRYVFLPIVRAYEFVTPDFVEDRISDFFANIGEIPNFANSMLQLKPEHAGRSATRFIVNTLFTAGLFDLAGARGVPPVNEDFGQTLGHWGVGPGPYLVIPVLGPSNVRDGVGIAADAALLWLATPAAVSESLAYSSARFGLQSIDTRHRTAFRYFETGSPFEYDLVRLIFTEKRKLDVAN
ncbi:MAG TPA: VacJ family lipoprotein [Geminicoccaceae bacterium]|nr:VacJ family lipoprotein [Geminicoccaceae bacterium]